jgi:hypothetical protein
MFVSPSASIEYIICGGYTYKILLVLYSSIIDENICVLFCCHLLLAFVRTYHEYAEVVIHVQEAELLPSLLGNDEERVREIQNLREVKYIQNECNGRILVVEFIARHDRVTSGIGAYASFDAHI